MQERGGEERRNKLLSGLKESKKTRSQIPRTESRIPSQLKEINKTGLESV